MLESKHDRKGSTSLTYCNLGFVVSCQIVNNRCRHKACPQDQHFFVGFHYCYTGSSGFSIKYKRAVLLIIRIKFFLHSEFHIDLANKQNTTAEFLTSVKRIVQE